MPCEKPPRQSRPSSGAALLLEGRPGAQPISDPPVRSRRQPRLVISTNGIRGPDAPDELVHRKPRTPWRASGTRGLPPRPRRARRPAGEGRTRARALIRPVRGVGFYRLGLHGPAAGGALGRQPARAGHEARLPLGPSDGSARDTAIAPARDDAPARGITARITLHLKDEHAPGLRGRRPTVERLVCSHHSAHVAPLRCALIALRPRPRGRPRELRSTARGPVGAKPRSEITASNTPIFLPAFTACRARSDSPAPLTVHLSRRPRGGRSTRAPPVACPRWRRSTSSTPTGRGGVKAPYVTAARASYPPTDRAASRPAGHLRFVRRPPVRFGGTLPAQHLPRDAPDETRCIAPR